MKDIEAVLNQQASAQKEFPTSLRPYKGVRRYAPGPGMYQQGRQSELGISPALPASLRAYPKYQFKYDANRTPDNKRFEESIGAATLDFATSFDIIWNRLASQPSIDDFATNLRGWTKIQTETQNGTAFALFRRAGDLVDSDGQIFTGETVIVASAIHPATANPEGKPQRVTMALISEPTRVQERFRGKNKVAIYMGASKIGEPDVLRLERGPFICYDVEPPPSQDIRLVAEDPIGLDRSLSIIRDPQVPRSSAPLMYDISEIVSQDPRMDLDIMSSTNLLALIDELKVNQFVYLFPQAMAAVDEVSRRLNP